MATRTSHRRWLLREVPHIVAVFAWASFGCAILTYFADTTSLQRWLHATYRGTAKATLPDDVNNGDKPYTGSILFVPPRGDFCAEWKFDNRNGNMSDNGQVNCSAMPQKDPNEGLSAMRMRAIGKAFKD